MRSRWMTTLAAALIGAAAGVVAMTAPAAAAACPRGTGVTVVVGSNVRCDAGGAGKAAANNFTSTGHSLTYVQRQPGFVCRVDGAPASDPCVNTPPPDAYWSLWWSNGTSGTWTFSTSGVGSLKVPAGGWVGFSFQNSNQKKPPGVTPRAAAAPAPKPSPKPSAKPTSSGSAGSSTAPQAPGAVTPKPTATKKPSKDKTEKAPSPAASASATAGAEASGPAASDLQKTSQESGGNDPLGWVAGGLVLALLVAMGAIAWRRRGVGGRQP